MRRNGCVIQQKFRFCTLVFLERGTYDTAMEANIVQNGNEVSDGDHY